MTFPTPRDLSLIRQATEVQQLSLALGDWMAAFGHLRREQDLAPIADRDEVELCQLSRMAANLTASARTPTAAAVYGPSQVGKSLFIGRVLAAADDDHTPLGRDESRGAPAYLPHLSFDVDLNPQSGSNEATALVTRFTTNGRLASDTPAEFPVVARAMNRGQWLRVLSRGFSVECAAAPGDWDTQALDSLVVELVQKHSAATVEPAWRRDLLDAFAYMHGIEPRRFPASESDLATALVRHPLSNQGCVALAARLFWDNWPSLTGLFLRIDEFLAGLASADHQPGLLLQWPAVRFLLDSKRAMLHERRASRCFPRVEWADFRLSRRGSWPVLEYVPGSGAGREPLETIQAAMLELVVPILPHRLNDDWRRVIEQLDILDIPGLRAGRQGAEQGKRTSADTLEEQLEILKRGKVAYLFEHYTEQLQIQTLLLLARGGNLEVTAQMKHHVDRWGQARYGAERWPSRVADELPALFIGLTGIDEEFRQRNEFAEPMLYETRLAQLSDALGPVMNQFGGAGRPFQNIYPLRYPGTWDANQAQQQHEGPDKWLKARQAFLASPLVGRFVAEPEKKWSAALRDNDGGLSLISAGWRSATNSQLKHAQLEARLVDTEGRLCELAARWTVRPDCNVDRDRRLECARVVLEWLMSDPLLVYQRVDALREALSVPEGGQHALSDFAEASNVSGGRPDALERRFPEELRAFLDRWATTSVVRAWEQHMQSHRDAGTWLGVDEIGRLATYLRDYLCLPRVFAEVTRRLLHVVTLKLRDEAARREGRRKYIRLVLNDLVLNPGLATLDPEIDCVVDGAALDHAFGLMTPFVRRWQFLLPEVLASGGGEEIRIPAGNQELINLMNHAHVSLTPQAVFADPTP